MDWYIGNEWKMERKGLRKVVLSLNFTKLEKPTQVSKVVIKVKEIENLQQQQKTNYLLDEKLNRCQELEMGTAQTPIDYYLEILVQQFVVGEEGRCFIERSNGEIISFVITLERILESKQIQTLSVREMYDRAKHLKEMGVTIFKEYPKFAHEYFVNAAKCLISYKPFKNLTTESDGIDSIGMEKLFINIQTNLAACLLAEKRYEDVIYQTEFVETDDTSSEPTEKGIYRRAMAFYCIKEYDKSQKTIEKLKNYHEKKEFVQLQKRIAESRKTSHDHYKNIVQRMFS